MGTFGLCDYLEQRSVTTRIFNPALYQETQVASLLHKQLEDFQPTHVGLILHWQETAHGMITSLDVIRSWNKNIPTICGGFTAGYFGESLLDSCPDLDCIIQGDPEEPLHQLLKGLPHSSIPNLIYRDQDTIRVNHEHWCIDQPTLDNLSFSRLEFLVDHKEYIKRINTKLGFPLFIGRGCVFNCKYCGGSRHAFKSHSHRVQPVHRSIKAILDDLHTLKEVTDTLYICFENDLQFIASLFQAIGANNTLKNHFFLNYGAWHLLDKNFINLYRQAFRYSIDKKPLFEFSPEVINDDSRLSIKQAATYSLQDLLDNVQSITSELNHQVRVDLFFSRYHPTEEDKNALHVEIKNIMRLKHWLFRNHLHTVRVCYDHLSTDVGSRYWEELAKLPSAFSTFLHLKEKVDTQDQYPFPVDNLCLYVPEQLPHEQRLRNEALLVVLEQLEENCHEFFHILFFCLGDQWLSELAETINFYLGKLQSSFFSSPPLPDLLTDFGEQINSGALSPHIPFIRDLVRFSCKKLEQGNRSLSQKKNSEEGALFLLASESLSIHEYDYLHLADFLTLLDDHPESPPTYQRTVYLYLSKEIITLPHAVYRNTLKNFEKPCRLKDYYDAQEENNAAHLGAHRQFIDKLIAEGIILKVTDQRRCKQLIE